MRGLLTRACIRPSRRYGYLKSHATSLDTVKRVAYWYRPARVRWLSTSGVRHWEEDEEEPKACALEGLPASRHSPSGRPQPYTIQQDQASTKAEIWMSCRIRNDNWQRNSATVHLITVLEVSSCSPVMANEVSVDDCPHATNIFPQRVTEVSRRWWFGRVLIPVRTAATLRLSAHPESWGTADSRPQVAEAVSYPSPGQLISLPAGRPAIHYIS